MAYTKLWHKIVTSSIWDADNDTRILWITMLALANQDGYVGSSFKSLAMLARLPEANCRKALNILMSPDEDSHTKMDDGRRVEQRDSGWQIINYRLYRDSTSDDPHAIANRERQREYRERQRALRSVTSRDPASASVSVSKEGDRDAGRGGNGEFDAFWDAYPRKVGKKAALKAWQKANDKPDLAAVLAAISAQVASDQWRKDGGQFIPHPATWLNQGRWADVVKPSPKAVQRVHGAIEVR